MAGARTSEETSQGLLPSSGDRAWLEGAQEVRGAVGLLPVPQGSMADLARGAPVEAAGGWACSRPLLLAQELQEPKAGRILLSSPLPISPARACHGQSRAGSRLPREPGKRGWPALSSGISKQSMEGGSIGSTQIAGVHMHPHACSHTPPGVRCVL